jgi:hypothetical protein
MYRLLLTLAALASTARAFDMPPARVEAMIYVVASPSPSVAGEKVTFTAVVASDVDALQVAGGTVTFFDGPTIIGTATLGETGRASITTTTLQIGNHPITAAFSGTETHRTSTVDIDQLVER